MARKRGPLRIIDDWSYIWSAKVLAEPGRLVYTGWSSSVLGWQLYLGALFIKSFGFSFTATRIPVMLLSLLSTALMHRIFVRLNIAPWSATIATLSVVLSPMFLTLSTTFMSDIPGLIAVFVLVCPIFCTG